MKDDIVNNISEIIRLNVFTYKAEDKVYGINRASQALYELGFRDIGDLPKVLKALGVHESIINSIKEKYGV